MEFVIMVCLLIVIALLLQDKFVPKQKQQNNSMGYNGNLQLPDIMGQPKLTRSLLLPKEANEAQNEESAIDPATFDIAYDDNEIISVQIPQEEPEEVISHQPDFEEEEEEWKVYGLSSSDDGFAQGVTFDELSAVGLLLQAERLQPTQKEIAVDLVHKIQGTELFSLLENSIHGASDKIAKLLDKGLAAGTETGSSIMRKNDLDGFDIGEFV